MLGSSLGHNLGNLFTFSGRSSQGQFWPYAMIVIYVGIMSPLFAFGGGSFEVLERFAAEHPDHATAYIRRPGVQIFEFHGYHPDMLVAFGPFLAAVAVAAVAVVAVLAASTVRRLHDTDRTGLWALLAPVGMIIRLTLTFIGAGKPNLILSALMLTTTIIYVAGIALLLRFLMQSGTAGTNRYGRSAAAS